MSYGGPKNPPWQRNTIGNNGQQSIPSLQTQMGLPNPGMVHFTQNQPVFNQGIGISQQQQQPNLSIISQIGATLANQIPPNQIFTQTVSYPAPRALNPIAFPQTNTNQSSHQSASTTQQTQQNQSSLNVNKNQRLYSGTGIVTKVQNDIGFVDEEVFFHKNVCIKGFPKTGDRVLVEASFNQNMPFKWNASRIQLLPNTNINVNRNPPGNNRNSNYNAVPPPTDNINNRNQNRNRNASPALRRSPERHIRTSRDNRHRDADEELDRKRRRDERDKEKEKSYREKRDHSIEKRERSPVRRSSPKRRRTRVVPRYMVQIPKICLNMTIADILELRRRYTNLYVPSDFFLTKMRWVDAFPPNAPFSIHKPCSFHIMHKDAESINEIDAVLDPPDADYLYSSKVMLMSVPGSADLYHKCFATAEEKDKDDDRDFIHPTRLINFLVGIRGKNETMAIGGPWSPSLDGPNPESDSSVLIRTAIRNCKALTGIDLSRCSQWYRFVELYYRRSETCHKGHIIPARIETVVIFLPDVRSCIPTRLEWDNHHISYKRILDRLINKNNNTSAILSSASLSSSVASDTIVCSTPSITTSTIVTTSAVPVAVIAAAAEAVVTTSVPVTDECSNGVSGAAEFTNLSLSSQIIVKNNHNNNNNINNNINKKDEVVSSQCEQNDLLVADGDGVVVVDGGGNGVINVNDIGEGANAAQNLNTDGNGTVLAIIEKGEQIEILDVKREPTPHNELDPKTMKVTDLREELAARNLSFKGLKQQLIARLSKAIKIEANQTTNKEDCNVVEEIGNDESVGETDGDFTDIVVIDEYDSTKSEEKFDEECEKIKKEVIKPLDEKERQLLERRYTLPDTPHIIVHPSRVAKSGKFDCTVMSLSLLLDYRPEDTKEHSFEVSLFAEIFNEMLMRDFGFNIYKSLYYLPEKEEKKKDDKAKLEDKKDTDIIVVDKDKESKQDEPMIINDEQSNDKEKKSMEIEKKSSKEHDKIRDKSKDRDRDRERDRENNKEVKVKPRRELHNDDDSENDDDFSIKSGDRKKKDKDRQKYYTAEPDLLLSFVYFDQTHCGYIFEKDIEELFYTLGLDLSRAQTRKLVSKVVTRDSLYYRKLTDKLKEEKDDGKTNDEKLIIDGVKQTNEKQQLEINIAELAKSNRCYLPTATIINDNHKEPLIKCTTDDNDNEQSEIANSTNGLVMYKGGLLNVEKLLEQIKRSEKAREDTEEILIELRKSNHELVISNNKGNNKIKDLSSELKSLNRKLNDTEQSFNSNNRKCNEYYSVISNIYDKLTPIFVKTDKRSESSRDKDNNKEKDRSDRNSGGGGVGSSSSGSGDTAIDSKESIKLLDIKKDENESKK